MTTTTPVHHFPTLAAGYRWVVLVVGTLGVFAALGLARFGYATVVPAMQQELGIGNTGAGAIASANLAGYLALAAIGGALASRYGPRVIAAVGLAIVGLAMILTGTAAGFTQVCLWRAVTGMGSGAANVAIMGMWPAWFPPHLRGRAAGVAVAGSSLALMLTGVLVPRLLAASADGWRSCWLLFGLIALGVAVLAGVLLRTHSSAAASPPAGADAPRQSPPAWGTVYRSRRVWHLGGVYAAFGFSYIIYLTFFTKYLVAERGYSSLAAGRLFFVLGVCSLVCGVLWGAVSDHLGRRAALVMVFLLQAVAYGLFILPGVEGTLMASAILFGLTAWSIPAVMAAACGDLLGVRLAAAGLGFITLFFGIGQALAPSLAGALADATGSFTGAFLLAGGVALVGAVGALLLPRMAAE